MFSIKTGELQSPDIVAAMHAAFIANEEAAKQFWDKVARGGIEYDETAPATVLDKWLVAAKAKDSKDKLKLGPGNFFRAVFLRGMRTAKRSR